MTTDDRAGVVTLRMLDGFCDGKQFFYHLVTDASGDLPAALENGAYCPRLGMVPTFAKTLAEDKSARLEFSPVLNGPTALGREQGFEASILHGGIDPINVFPYGPDNEHYSPLWDAHVVQWIEGSQKTRITGFQELGALIGKGMVTNASINPPGPEDPSIFHLRSTGVIINCPVICQPRMAPSP